MGVMNFLLPAEVDAGLVPELERAWVAGSPDNMPWPTTVRREADRLVLRRGVDESGFLVAPWDVAGIGRVMSTSGTLVERASPYHSAIELARGKVNQLRNQTAEWQAGGLVVPPDLADEIRLLSVAFGRAASQSSADQGPAAHAVLEQSYQLSHRLVELYIEQMFQARHQRQSCLDTTLGCRIGATALPSEQADLLLQTCNTVSLAFAWNEIEPVEGTYQWDLYDAAVNWVRTRQLPVTAGPLIDFSAGRLPAWLWLWERDLRSLAHLMCDYVQTVVKRYAPQIRTWQLSNASNCANILGLDEEELLWLTARLVEAARQVDATLELVVGLGQPWGEYMAVEDRTHSPFIFADTLMRAGFNLAALDLEIVMGVWPRGSYCRDLLETSRLIDLYSLLGVPLRVTLGYPSSSAADPFADAELRVGAGYWQGGWTPQVQANWTAACAALAVCKPSVRSVQWVHWSDALPHQFPHCGLVDGRQQPKPALAQLQALRAQHLR
jgi:hypothetical protein